MIGRIIFCSVLGDLVFSLGSIFPRRLQFFLFVCCFIGLVNFKMGKETVAKEDPAARDATTLEAIQSLVNQVAQLKNDNTRLMQEIGNIRQGGTVFPSLDSSAANLVTPFSGKPGEDVTAFFDNLLAASKVGLWTDEQLLQITKLRLVGEAKAHVLYNEELRNALTFDELKTGLLKRFQRQNSTRFYREKLNTISQRQNETLDSYVDRIRKVNINTYQLTDNDMVNKVILQEAESRALDTFLRGLPAEMSRRVRAEFPKSLDEAVSLATAFEEIDVATRAKERRSIFPAGVRCFRCDQQGHIAKNCRIPQCRFCHKIGHLDKDCRAKRDSDRRRPLNGGGGPRAAVSGPR